MLSLLTKKVPSEKRLVNGVTALMAEQKMVQKTHVVEATDMGQRPSPSRSDIQSFHKNTVVTAGLGVSDVAQVPAGIIHSRSQGKHFWRALGSEGIPPCSFEMTLVQCQGTAGSPVVREVEQRILCGKRETAANKTFKDNICCKTPMVKTIKSQDCFKQLQL